MSRHHAGFHNGNQKKSKARTITGKHHQHFIVDWSDGREEMMKYFQPGNRMQ